MRVILERSNLLKSLNHVHRVVERRNTIPILSNVLLAADGASLEMKATDLDLEVTEATPARVEQGGATTVPAHLLYDIVRKLPEGAEVMLKTDEDGTAMTVISGRSSFRLQCLPQSDFPELSAGSFSHIFRLDSTALKGLIDKTQFAISTEETRYYLNGIYLHTVDVDGRPVLRAVATDGHRLARVDTAAPQGSAGMPGVIVPRKAVAEIQKLLDDDAADAELVDHHRGTAPCRGDDADARALQRGKARHDQRGAPDDSGVPRPQAEGDGTTSGRFFVISFRNRERNQGANPPSFAKILSGVRPSSIFNIILLRAYE